MSNITEHKAQRHFVKDGDDDFSSRRPRRAASNNSPRTPYKKCYCGGKLRPRGSIGTSGHTSAKCNKCGQRNYTKTYKGTSGLVVCY